MTIDFKQNRYVLPLIVLPFLCLFFYAYKSVFHKETAIKKESNSLQENVVDVSDKVKNTDLANKLDAYLNQYKEADGYTAVGELGEEQARQQTMPDLYNQREKQMLDSIEKAVRAKYGGGGNPYQSSPLYNSNPTFNQNEDKNLTATLMRLKENSRPNSSNQQKLNTEPDPITVFRQQMALIDSMGKANDPDFKAEQSRQRQIELAEKESKERVKLSVRKASDSSPIFNTIQPVQEHNFISAIIDEDVTGYAGSRLRIRLLEDMTAGRFLIKQGSYLYAQVSGFSAQRVSLTVSTIMQGDKILPVNLCLYDYDGLPGLYVPASIFREFSKELGGNSVQGINLQNQAETNSQLVMSMVQKMFQSTSTAVTKLIRQNKARIKYNTRVYLIDPDELKNNQKNY